MANRFSIKHQPGFTAIADRPGEALYATQASMYFVRGDEAKRITDSEDLAPFCRPRRDRYGDVWYLTKQHLVRVRGDRFTTLPLPPGLQPVPRRQQFWWQSAAGDLWFEVDGQVWRIGLMGASASPLHVRMCLTALADALAAQGQKVSASDALTAAEARL